jgi:hypothetical protein
MKVDVQNRPVMAGSLSAVKRSKQIRYFWTRKRKWFKSQTNPYFSYIFGGLGRFVQWNILETV